MSVHRIGGKYLRWVLSVGVLLAVVYAYDQGSSGGLFYDDLSNLSGLEELESWDDIKEFVTSGTSGPLGRPIALASFLVHAKDWPLSVQDAIRVNIGIHILNGILLWFLGCLVLARSGKFLPEDVPRISFLAAILWLVLPLSASATLITIQRMTGLSVLFGLVGLCGYFYFQSLAYKRLLLGTIGSLFFLFFFTSIGVLTKENAVLFPVFALLIEIVFPKGQEVDRRLSFLRLGALWLVLLAVLWQLWTSLPEDIFTVNSYRGFSLFERLLTQAVLLPEYLRLAFLPDLNAYGPFHDDVQVVTEWRWPLISVLGIVGVILIALKIKRHNPFLLFALLWFFVGHLIESTVVMLELYFEHRNYIAIYGWCLLLSCFVFMASQSCRKILVFAFGGYIVVQWCVLLMLTNIWGEPLGAAENWVKNRPGSSRAVMSLAGHYYQETGVPAISIAVLDRSMSTCPDCLDLRMQALLLACNSEDEGSVMRRYEKFLNVASVGKSTPASTDGFYPLRELIQDENCKPLGTTNLWNMLDSLERNPRYLAGENYIHLTYLRAVVAADLRDYEVAHGHLASLEAQRDILAAIMLKAQIMLEQGEQDSAMEYVYGKYNSANNGGISQAVWNKKINELVEFLAAKGGE